MRRTPFSVTLVIVLLSTAGFAQTVYETVVEPPSPVLRIGVDGRWACSGVYLASDYVLTAGHCFSHGLDSKLTVGTSDGRTLQAHLSVVSLIESALDDWALLWVEGSSTWKTVGAKLDCRREPLPVGTLVESLGYPGSVDTLVHAWGRIAAVPVALADAPWVMPVYIAQLPVGHGSSGGPVFEPDGRIFATMVGLNPDQSEWGVLQPLQAVCAALHLPEDTK